jgi:protein-S-isoprenylcysteine O-methyltransferase Ste14
MNIIQSVPSDNHRAAPHGHDGHGADQVNPPTDDAEALAHEPANTDVRTARLLVTGQFALIATLVLLPGRNDWPVPAALAVACSVVTVVGLVVMVIAATGLGRGLTATPLPNAHAQLRTGGIYRYARHPIYSGLLLTMTSITVASGSMFRLLTLGALVLLITVKARWEEKRLNQRFEGYASYAARTPRFVSIRLRH